LVGKVLLQSAFLKANDEKWLFVVEDSSYFPSNMGSTHMKTSVDRSPYMSGAHV
jgi:hypothetical protein